MDVYFDNAATTVVSEEVSAEMQRVMREEYGNPSSAHYMGRRAADELEKARGSVAAALGAGPDEVFFTSGGTEADNWAILGAAEIFKHRRGHIITSAVEHDAVIEPVKKLKAAGWEITCLLPDSSGRIPAEAFAAALRDDTVFASVMLVNNETGAVNPVNEYAKEVQRRRLPVVIHTDAVQGFCKTPINAKRLGASLISVSAHKIHGPKGVGALYIKKGIKLPRMIFGGNQENGKRAGTEALPAIAGFGEAARTGLDILEKSAAGAAALREYIVKRLAEELPETVFIGSGDSPYLLNLSLPGYKSEVILNFLESEGICAAKGAACKKGARSHVLEAMRLSNRVIDGAIRISFSRYNTMVEADYFVNTLKKAAYRLIRV